MMHLERVSSNAQPNLFGINLPVRFENAFHQVERATTPGVFPPNHDLVCEIVGNFTDRLEAMLPAIIEASRLPKLEDVENYIPPAIKDFHKARALAKGWTGNPPAFVHRINLNVDSSDYRNPRFSYNVITSLVYRYGTDPANPNSMLCLSFSPKDKRFTQGHYYEYLYTDDEIRVLNLVLAGDRILGQKFYHDYQSAVVTYKSLGSGGNAILVSAYPFPDTLNLADFPALSEQQLQLKPDTLLLLPKDPETQPALMLDEVGFIQTYPAL